MSLSRYNPQVDVNSRIDELKEKTTRVLMSTNSDPTTTMKLIDTIQRLGIGYVFEEEIHEILEKLTQGLLDDSLYTVALRFRLQRHNGLHSNPEVFQKFMDANGKFKESLSEDIEGLLSLHEASHLGANGEDILSQGNEFTTRHLKGSVSQLSPKLGTQVLGSLELPRHLRMARLEAARYIEEYGNADDHNPVVLELAKLDYNHVQSLLQRDLNDVTRWWKHLGLASKLSFVRDRHIECFFWTVGVLPEPKYSSSRIVLAKTIAILLVIDDVFDTYGSYEDLVHFTKAIKRWDLNEMEQLPKYMKLCYMALYTITSEICDKILTQHGFSVQPFLSKTWMDLVEAYLVEVEWVRRGTLPNLEDYIENGFTSSGTCMALVHLFFLISQGVTEENARKLLDPYPKFFSLAGTILRLWDDLGTAKEEEKRGDAISSIQLLMREKNITNEEEGRKQILQLIHGLWKDLNAELVTPDALLLPMIKVALNVSRASQVVYQHSEDSYLSSVQDYVQTLFFKPIYI
nr:geraniol synthase [Atractylodes lancea]